MARNDQEDRSRRQSSSPNSRDFDREYNEQGSQGRERNFESQYSGNAERWTGNDEGRQHNYRENRDFERGGYREDDYRNRQQDFGRDYRREERGYNWGPSYGQSGNYGQGERDERRYNRDDWGRETGPGMSGRGDRGSFQGDQGRDDARGPGGMHDSGRGNWGGQSTYGSGVSGYSPVGPYSSAGFGGSYSGMGSYGSGFSGGMGSYSQRGGSQNRGQFQGRGPKGYRRSDDRIREEISERMTDHPDIDPSDVEIQVQNGEVTLTGSVDHRHAKRLAEDIAEGVAGVRDVHNQIRVNKNGENKQQEDEQQVTRLGVNPGDRKLKDMETSKK